MKTNVKKTADTKTHEGAPAWTDNPERELRRAVLSCLLWEDQFYEDGEEIAARIVRLASALPAETVASLAVEARSVFNLRHVPLLLLTVLAKTGAGKPKLVANTIEAVVQRADELGELLSLYWKGGKKPLPAQFKKGLARAFLKFNAYGLGKYNRDAAVKLRDVLFLTHAKPKDEEQATTWKKLVEKTLESPDTWEVALSAGADKRETFARLIKEDQLGYLALLRNLRNMAQSGVDDDLVKSAIVARKNGAQRVFPFRYIAAARAAPQYERAIDSALLAAIGEMEAFDGKTVILVDVSGSMDSKVSGKSEMTRMDAGAALAAIFPGDVRFYTFSNDCIEVPARKGMAGVDAIMTSQGHGGTRLGAAVEMVNRIKSDRLIVITDEQSHDVVPQPNAVHAYMINVASYKPSVSYGAWIKIEGFSEGVLRYIREFENS